MESHAHRPVSLPIPNPLPSYWLSSPSPLSGHQHTPDVPETSDFVIIGSGITGTLIAYGLIARFPTATITMLEARDVCSGATGRNGGHTKAASYRMYLEHCEELGVQEARKIARLEWENIIEMHALARKEGLAAQCESVACRTVDLVYDQETFDMGKKAIEAIRNDASEEDKNEDQWAWYRVYNADEAMRKFHVTRKNANEAVERKENLVGAFEYAAGRMIGYKLATALLEKCVKKGLKLYTYTPATEIASSSANMQSLSRGTTNSVTTPRGRILSPNIILATNGYTAHILPETQSIIVPFRGQITAQRPGKSTKLPAPLPVTYSFIYRDGYEYLITRELSIPSTDQQHIIIGGGLTRLPNNGASEYGTCNDGELNPLTSRYLRGTCVGYFGRENWGDDSVEERVVQEWTGIMGATPDGWPLVGEVPGRRGVWIAAGFNGHGT